MNTTTRETPGGLILIRGKRELHLVGTSVDAMDRARRLAATYSFDRLYRASRSLGGVRYIDCKVGRR